MKLYAIILTIFSVHCFLMGAEAAQPRLQVRRASEPSLARGVQELRQRLTTAEARLTEQKTKCNALTSDLQTVFAQVQRYERQHNERIMALERAAKNQGGLGQVIALESLRCCLPYLGAWCCPTWFS